MEQKAIKEKVISIITSTLNVDKESVTDQATLESLGADSLDMLEIIMKLEESFGVEIDDEQAEHIQTVGQAIESIEQLLKSKT